MSLLKLNHWYCVVKKVIKICLKPWLFNAKHAFWSLHYINFTLSFKEASNIFVMKHHLIGNCFSRVCKEFTFFLSWLAWKSQTKFFDKHRSEDLIAVQIHISEFPIFFWLLTHRMVALYGNLHQKNGILCIKNGHNTKVLEMLCPYTVFLLTSCQKALF